MKYAVQSLVLMVAQRHRPDRRSTTRQCISGKLALIIAYFMIPAIAFAQVPNRRLGNVIITNNNTGVGNCPITTGTNTGAWQGCGSGGVLAPEQFGAIGNDIADDTTAIQNWYNAGCLANGTGRIVGTQGKYYRTRLPIKFNCAYGMDIGYLNLDPQFFGPAVILTGTGDISVLGALTATSLATGPVGSASMNWEQTNGGGFNGNYAIPVKETTSAGGCGVECGGQALNGLSNFTFQAFAKIPSTATGSLLFISSSARTNPVVYGGSIGQGQAYYLRINVAGPNDFRLQAAITTNGVLTESGNIGSFTSNTAHHVMEVLDNNGGSPHVCVFLDGVRVWNQAVTGTMTQQVPEDWYVGAISQKWPNDAPMSHWVGQIDGVEIADTNRQSCNTASFTPPTAKPTYDGHSFLLWNFTNPTQIAATGLVKDDTSLPAYSYLRTNSYNANVAGPHVFHDSTIAGVYNTGFICTGSPNQHLSNISISGANYQGMEFYNNCYNAIIHNVSIAAGGLAESALKLAFNDFDDVIGVHIVGGLWQVASSADLTNTRIVPTSVTQVALYAFNEGPSANLHCVNCNLDSEAGGPTIAGVEYEGGGSYTFSGGAIAVPAGVPAIILDPPGVAPMSLKTYGTYFTVALGNGPLIHFGADPNGTEVGVDSLLINGLTEQAWAAIGGHTFTDGRVAVTTPCDGKVTLAGGAGTFTDSCIAQSSKCEYVDTTTFGNAVTLAAPANGSVGITGTGTDVIRVICR
jgi:hypothetical protein